MASYPMAAPEGVLKERDKDKEGSSRILTLKSSKSRSLGPVLTEKEVQTVCRNAQELLRYHERFVDELCEAVGVSGFRAAFAQSCTDRPEQMGGDGVEEVERAVEVVAAKFVNEAAFFGIYETFCSGHAAAADLIRRVQERWPTAWDAYEQRCALLVSTLSLHPRVDETKDDQDADISSQTSPGSEVDGVVSPPEQIAKRRHSTPIVFPTASSSNTTDITARGRYPFPTSSPASAVLPSSSVDNRLRESTQKLKFIDYLIKPVQRICKYSLLLDQLHDKRRKHAPPEDDSTPTDGVTNVASRDTVRRAGEAMRSVVSRVNRASEKEAHNLRSALIASRIAFQSGQSSATTSSAQPSTASTPSSSACPSSSHGHSNSMSSSSCASSAPTSPSSCTPTPLPAIASTSRATALTTDFVSSLGPCMLAGALDVVQYPAARAKYLGAFLYAGGYCILAKITKGGRVYEPRHWFSLSEVEVVVDVEEEDALFPYTFRISGYGHQLQLAASCSQEKAIWMAAINDALSAQPSWMNEPLSSLQADDKTPVSSSAIVADDQPQDVSVGLPTIQSLSDLEKQSEVNGDAYACLPSPAKLRYSKTLFRLDGTASSKPEHYSQAATFSAALSRRSSTASVKAFFSPISFEPTRIARPSAQVRAQVEHGVHDVFSESCLAARAQAQMRGEELFQVRLPGNASARRQGNVPRSNSGISIASAMGFTAAKRKYDSVLVARRKSSVDLDMPPPPLPTSATLPLAEMSSPFVTAESGGFSLRAKTLAARRRGKLPSSIAPAISTAIAQMNTEEARASGILVRSPDALSLDSPPDASRSSSGSSVLPSPVDSSPLPIPIPVSSLSPSGTVRRSDIHPPRGREGVPKRSRSVVNNVRSFFQQPRPESPASSSSSSEQGHASATPPLSADAPGSDYSSSIVQWLRRTSIRGRNSASSSFAVSGAEDPPSLDRRRPMPTRTSTDGVAMRNLTVFDVTPSQSPREHGAGNSPKRHRSLFVPSSRSRSGGFGVREEPPREKEKEEGDASPSAPDAQAGGNAALSARKSLKNMLLFQRSTAMTPVDAPS